MRNGFWQFVYDWQTLAAGLLALLAAIITGAILWGQLKSAARQAAAAERQAFLAITDALKRQLLSIDDLKTEIGKLDNSIGSIELFKASQEDMDKLREVKSGIVDRLYDIRRVIGGVVGCFGAPSPAP